jgi:FkbH-like protein
VAVSAVHIMMDWLPQLADTDRAIGAVSAAGSNEEAVKVLATVANHRLGFLETIKLDKALSKITPVSVEGFARVKVAILGSTTLDHLAPAIRVAGLRRKLLIDVYTGAYGQYRQEILDSHSALRQFAAQFVVLSIASMHVLERIPIATRAEAVESVLNRAVAELETLWRTIRATHGATVIQQTFLDSSAPIFGNYDSSIPASPFRLVTRLNELVTSAAMREGALLLDIAGRCWRDGLARWYDVTRWLQAKQEIAPQVAPLYGELLVRIFAAQLGRSYKCLVLDLDNTLWGGVVGDDGTEGIVVGNGSASGEAYLALQHYVLALKERGVVLAVCSKNDASIAQAPFSERSDLALRKSDFAAFVANWEDKSVNLQTIARQLNLGLDSLVFVDDNPAERARIREELPMVAVPELPEDPAHYVGVLADAGYFEATSLTDDDLERAAHYAANADRQALKDTAGSTEEFLRGLAMSVSHGPFRSQDLPRVAQLMNKTNQFNTTTKRYSPEEIEAIAGEPRNMTLQFRLSDRFGDNGLVSAMIMRPTSSDATTLELENWVMSCRVFGRELEYEAMNIAVEAARQRGARTLVADYIPSSKNGVIKDLYPRLGFQCIQHGAETKTRWLLELTRHEFRSTQIRRSQQP